MPHDPIAYRTALSNGREVGLRSEQHITSHFTVRAAPQPQCTDPREPAPSPTARYARRIKTPALPTDVARASDGRPDVPDPFDTFAFPAVRPGDRRTQTPRVPAPADDLMPPIDGGPSSLPEDPMLRHVRVRQELDDAASLLPARPAVAAVEATIVSAAEPPTPDCKPRGHYVVVPAAPSVRSPEFAVRQRMGTAAPPAAVFEPPMEQLDKVHGAAAAAALEAERRHARPVRPRAYAANLCEVGEAASGRYGVRPPQPRFHPVPQ